jgi:pimeloyl-ACP methyl ester carboxylesterase
MSGYVYLHGFASSPNSSKAHYFKARLAQRGVHVEVPELDEGDFEHLTLSAQLRLLERILQNEPAVLFGSSMGGYLAALYAEKHPEVERLVLLAPAFDFCQRWAERMGADDMEKWEASGKLRVFHYADNRYRDVNYALWEDARQHTPYPNVSQPTLIFHGERDDVVPPAHSQRFTDLHPNAELHIMDSGHELTNVLPDMWARTEKFLFA